MRMRTNRVLIADDDAAMLGLLGRMLCALDLEVIEAQDAVSALALANETAPDVIILDIGMPGGNGLSACEMLASTASLAHVPVIVLTGRSDDATLFRCQNMGAHYVCKGADALAKVRSMVRVLLGIGDEASGTNPELFVG